MLWFWLTVPLARPEAGTSWVLRLTSGSAVLIKCRCWATCSMTVNLAAGIRKVSMIWWRMWIKLSPRSGRWRAERTETEEQRRGTRMRTETYSE